ncbi:hypothetical protein P7C73_g6381, partial [Tremellales sp. Uapishka_1]
MAPNRDAPDVARPMSHVSLSSVRRAPRQCFYLSSTEVVLMPYGSHRFVQMLKSDNTSLSSQIQEANDRIRQLETVISAMESDIPPYPPIRSTSPGLSFSTISKSILNVQNEPSWDALPSDPLPPYDVAKAALECYFLYTAASYPFLDKTETTRHFEDLYGTEGKPDPRNEFVVCMVLAVGSVYGSRYGVVDRSVARAWRAKASNRLQIATATEDVLCIQALLLVGLYSLYNPSEMSLWHVIGFAARIALSLNLHRQSAASTLPSQIVQQRYRVFWSLYNLDRLVATTLNKALAIADSDIGIDPSTLISESIFTSHITGLRRLSGEIHTSLYSSPVQPNSISDPDRSSIIRDLHLRLDSWLAQCPTLGPQNNWFMSNYHQTLCLLYRPSPLFPIITPEHLTTLHDSSACCVGVYLELWYEKRIAYNLINVSQHFLACITLMFCLCEYDSRDVRAREDENWRKEVLHRVGQCAELMSVTGKTLAEASKLRGVFERLKRFLDERYGSTGIESERSGESGAGDAIKELWYDAGGFEFDAKALEAITFGQGKTVDGADGVDLWRTLG